jgi:hypothetical protein
LIAFENKAQKRLFLPEGVIRCRKKTVQLRTSNFLLFTDIIALIKSTRKRWARHKYFEEGRMAYRINVINIKHGEEHLEGLSIGGRIAMANNICKQMLKEWVYLYVRSLVTPERINRTAPHLAFLFI